MDKQEALKALREKMKRENEPPSPAPEDSQPPLTGAVSAPSPEPNVTLEQFQELKDEVENEQIEREAERACQTAQISELEQKLESTNEQLARTNEQLLQTNDQLLQTVRSQEHLKKDAGEAFKHLAGELAKMKSEQNRRALPPPQEPKTITHSAQPKPDALPPATTPQTPPALTAKPAAIAKYSEVYPQPAYNPPRRVREELVYQPSKLEELMETATTLFMITVGILVMVAVVALLYVAGTWALGNPVMTISIVLMFVGTLIAAAYWGVMMESKWVAGFVTMLGVAMIVLITIGYVQVFSSAAEAEPATQLGGR